MAEAENLSLQQQFQQLTNWGIRWLLIRPFLPNGPVLCSIMSPPPPKDRLLVLLIHYHAIVRTLGQGNIHSFARGTVL